MKTLFTVIAFVLVVSFSYAQKEYDKWYFGNQAGIDFASGAAVALTNSAMTETDNPATVSDSLGYLLFYSNGIQVWNRNHTLMPNGNGLLGHLSGGHTATTVRQPGSSNLYYLFTMDAFAGGNGLRYNVIDMNLNGGLGDIVTGQKNIVLLNPASEQIIPVVAANGNDIWIVTHPWNSSSFNSYLLSCSGLNSTPVVSTVGTTRSGNTNNALGQINVNAANDRIAWANWGTGNWELFDFDNTSGILSNALTFTGYNLPWAIEFSPDGSKLYLSGWSTQYVSQFDLTTYSQAAIAASEVNLGNVTGPGAPYFTGYMQRAPDGKIYIAVYLDSHLAVINNPNATGTACNLVDDGFNLNGKTSSAGLPDKVVVTHQSIQVNLGPDTSYCGSFSHTLSTGNPNTVWSTGVTAAQITVTTSGTYWASIASGCITASDTIVISSGTSPVPFTLGPDTSYCGSFSHTLSTGNPNTLWSTGITASQITVSNGGTYSATVSNGCGTASDTVVLTQNTAPVVNLGSNATLCTGQTLLLDATSTGAIYHWQDNSTNATFNVAGAGTYSVTVTNATGCAATGSVDVSYNTQAPVVSLGADTEICGNQGLVLRAGVPNANYLWSTNSNDSLLNVSTTGTYSLTVTTGCGSATDAIHIEIHADECMLLIPTAFSPNGDGSNDVFRAVSRCPVSRYYFKVYNRWGELVFETTYPDEGWNGVFRSREQPLGVYVYYIDYFNYCEQKMKKVAGNVTLVR